MSIEHISSTVNGICCRSASSGRVSMFTVNVKQANVSIIIIIIIIIIKTL